MVEDLLLLRTYINDLAGGTKQPSSPPLVVHCSAGVGRTGTYIAVDRAINQALDMSETLVDIDEIVASMRAARNLMVQTEEQYLCIHSTVLAGVSWLLKKEQGKIRNFSSDSQETQRATAIYDNNYHLAAATPELPALLRRSTQFAINEEEEVAVDAEDADELEAVAAAATSPGGLPPTFASAGLRVSDNNSGVQMRSVRRENPMFDPKLLPPSIRTTAFEPPEFHLDAFARESAFTARVEAEATETGTDAESEKAVAAASAVARKRASSAGEMPILLQVEDAGADDAVPEAPLTPKMARQKRREAMEQRAAETEQQAASAAALAEMPTTVDFQATLQVLHISAAAGDASATKVEARSSPVRRAVDSAGLLVVDGTGDAPRMGPRFSVDVQLQGDGAAQSQLPGQMAFPSSLSESASSPHSFPSGGSSENSGASGAQVVPFAPFDFRSSSAARSVSDYGPGIEQLPEPRRAPLNASNARSASVHLPRALSIRTSSYSEALNTGEGGSENEMVPDPEVGGEGPLSPPAQDC